MKMIKEIKMSKSILRTAAMTLTLGLLLTGCGESDKETITGQKEEPATVMANAVNLAEGITQKEVTPVNMQDPHRKALSEGAVKLLQKTMETEGNPDGNYLISPFSLQMAFGMLTTGAEDGSETEKELMELLLPGENATSQELNEEMAALAGRMRNASGVEWNVADSIWVKKDGDTKLRESYISDVISYYQAELYAAPFDESTVKEINAWVKDNTKERIPEILNQLDPQASLVLINALAFDGTWAKSYEDYQVKKNKDFTNADGTKTKATMLYGEENGYVQIAGGKGFLKWYKDGNYAFLGLLPTEGVTTEDYLKKILAGDENLADAIRNADYEPTLEVVFPEFKTEYGVNMNEILQALGVKKAYSPDAEFGKMITDDSERIAVDQVIHKTMIEVDRTGTKAAAATAITATEAAIIDTERIQIVLDRPFIYGIIDMTTGVPIFLGAQNTMKTDTEGTEISTENKPEAGTETGSENNTEATGMDVESYRQLTGYIDDKTVEKYCCTLTFENPEDRVITFSPDEYVIEAWKDDQWISVPLLRGIRCSGLTQSNVQPGKKVQENINWISEYGELSPGKYRMIISATYDETDETAGMIVAEFKIEDKEETGIIGLITGDLYDPAVYAREIPEFGIRMDVENPNANGCDLKFTYTENEQTGHVEFMVGEGYYFQKWEGDHWGRLLTNYSYGVVDVGYGVPTTRQVRWNELFGEQSPGIYRIITPVVANRLLGAYKIFYLSSVFLIEQNTAEDTFGKVYSILWGDEENELSRALLPYYGGSYINDGHYTICFRSDVPAGKIEELRGEMIKAGVSEQTFSVCMVDYSEEDLKKQMEDFWQFRTQKEKEGAEWAKLIYGSGVDTEHNDINIDVDESLDIDSYPELKEKLSTIKCRINQMNSAPRTEDWKSEGCLAKPADGYKKGR